MQLKSLKGIMAELSQEVLEAIANNDNFKDKELLEEISFLFKDRPEASEYLYLYGQYCEVMDDLVDESVTPDMVDRAGLLRMQIDVCPYWVANRTLLWLTERIIHHTYFDAVQWERAKEEWKRRDARVLNHCAYNMLFTVILIEFGDETLRKISLRFREHAHKRHIDDKI